MRYLFKKRNLTFFMIAALLVGGFFVIPVQAEITTTWNVNVEGGACTIAEPDCSTIQSAVAAAQDGDVIDIGPGEYSVTETIVVEKEVLIKGAPEHATKLLTSSSDPVFNLNASSTLDSIYIQKQNKVDQSLILITSNDVTIKNSKFVGNYVRGDGEVVRAILPNAGIINYVIDGNYFESVRQPAYLEGSGIITNNFLKNTKGWVVCVNRENIFKNNTFDNNVVDIAIIANGQTESENYQDVVALSRGNGGAFVENQLSGMSSKNSALYKTIYISSNGSVNYYTSIQSAILAAQDGDTINLAPGTYVLNSQIRIKKAISIIGAGETTILTPGTNAWTNLTGSKGFAPIITVMAGEHLVSLENFKVTGAKTIIVTPTFKDYGHGINIVSSANVNLKNIISSSNAGAGLIVNSSIVVAENLNTSNNGWYGVNVDKADSVDASFTLIGNGIIGESTQIISDKTIGVNVLATGYNQYKFNGKVKTVWANKLKEVAIINKGNVSTLYSTIMSAINMAEDGDTINIAPGNYNLNKDDKTLVSGQTGWYLPITKNNITLSGITANGQEITNPANTVANIYSTQETANGSWSSQNLITVFGDNVTFKGLAIMNKISPNKAIEVLGDNFKAENCNFTPIPVSLFSSATDYHDVTDNSDYNDISKYGSGVYFNNNSATTTRTANIINNIFKNSGITFDSFKDNWTVNINGNIFNGNKVWSWTDSTGLNNQYYSTISATTWANQPDFTGSNININNNQFINMISEQPVLKIKDTMTGLFIAKNNWWGSVEGPTKGMLLGNISYNPWYVDHEMTSLSSEKNITQFNLESQGAIGVINDLTNSIELKVPHGTNISSLIPTIKISPYALISPFSGVNQNFTNPVTYTVTAVDGTTKKYIVNVTVAAGNNNGGGGGGSVSYCSNITYSEWGACTNGNQYRDVLTQSPSYCSLSVKQQLDRSRPCATPATPATPGVTPATPAKPAQPVTKKVLGEKKYTDGTLLRGTNNRIYVVSSDALKYISSLKELAEYSGQIIKVEDSVIASFVKTSVLGAKRYTNNTLIKANGDTKIYVIKDGKKVHVRSLAELKQYKGRVINITASELNNY